MTNKKTNILPIVVMFLLFFMIAFVTNFAGSMGVIVKNQFGASSAMAQLGTLANFIAYAVMGVPAGLILKRKGYKFTSLLAVSVGFVGVGVQWLSGYAESFGVYVLGAFIAGFSMCLLNIVVNPMLNTLGGKRGNQLIQFGGSCNSIGGTLAPIILGYLIGGSAATAQVGDAAPAMLAAMLIFLLAFVIISLTKIPEPHIETAEQRAAAKSQKSKYSPLSFRHFVLGAVAIFFYVGVEIGIPAELNFYLSNMGFEGSAAIGGTLAAVYWFLMMIGRMLSSAISGKVSTSTQMTIVSTTAIVLLLIAIFLPESVAIQFEGHDIPVKCFFIAICGICTSIMWGGIFNLAVEGLGKYTAAASGLFMTMVVGGGIMPLIQHAIAQKVGAIPSYWLVIAMLAYILYYSKIGCKNVNKDIPVE